MTIERGIYGLSMMMGRNFMRIMTVIRRFCLLIKMEIRPDTSMICREI